MIQDPNSACPALAAPAERVCGPDPDKWRALAPPKRSPAGLALRGLCRRAGKLIADHQLIHAGDRVLCALSGGKDSLTLLEVLLRLQSKAHVSFDLAAVIVHPGFDGFDARRVTDFCRDRGVETFLVRANVWDTMQAVGWGRSPCSLCSRLRRGVLYRVAPTVGATSLALGHHADDAIETALMNMLFNGQLRAMAARYVPDPQTAPPVIRPLLTCFESDIIHYTKVRGMKPVPTPCPLCATDQETERLAIKQWLTELSVDQPRVRSSLLAALGNVSPDALMDQRLFKR